MGGMGRIEIEGLGDGRRWRRKKKKVKDDLMLFWHYYGSELQGLVCSLLHVYMRPRMHASSAIRCWPRLPILRLGHYTKMSYEQIKKENQFLLLIALSTIIPPQP